MSRRKKIGIVVLGLLVLSAAVVGFAVRSRSRLPRRFSVVEPGVLYRSSQPHNNQLENIVADYGIKTLVIAREAASKQVPKEMKVAKEHGLRVLHIPIESRKPITEQQAEEFLRCVDDPASRPVLVHCSAGRHRTGYLCGLYRIERQGWTVTQAVEEMLSFGAAENGAHPLIDQLRQYRSRRVSPATSQSLTSKPATSGPARK